ncbi:MAG: TSUP family transporter [Candidatus Faecousia sp.]|nr:TSUP family transporter [Candidatus Faecousia sp.]
MRKKIFSGIVLAGACAGAVNGLLGAGGGMLLVPMLSAFTSLREDEIFPSSVAIIAPICVVSLLLTRDIAWAASFPFLLGSALGGFFAGLWGKKIPTLWLHRGLGVLIVWGGLRYLCQTS